MSINLVPVDVFANIMQFLDWPQVCSMESVSQLWRVLLQSNEVWMRQIDKEKFPLVNGNRRYKNDFLTLEPIIISARKMSRLGKFIGTVPMMSEQDFNWAKTHSSMRPSFRVVVMPPALGRTFDRDLLVELVDDYGFRPSEFQKKERDLASCIWTLNNLANDIDLYEATYPNCTLVEIISKFGFPRNEALDINYFEAIVNTIITSPILQENIGNKEKLLAIKEFIEKKYGNFAGEDLIIPSSFNNICCLTTRLSKIYHPKIAVQFCTQSNDFSIIDPMEASSPLSFFAAKANIYFILNSDFQLKNCDLEFQSMLLKHYGYEITPARVALLCDSVEFLETGKFPVQGKLRFAEICQAENDQTGEELYLPLITESSSVIVNEQVSRVDYRVYPDANFDRPDPHVGVSACRIAEQVPTNSREKS